MKSLVPWVCLIVASAGQQAFADDFSAYRLGNYNNAIEPLMSQSGKNAVADYYLGRIYLYGYGQLKNNQLAIRYFTQSAQKDICLLSYSWPSTLYYMIKIQNRLWDGLKKRQMLVMLMPKCLLLRLICMELESRKI